MKKYLSFDIGGTTVKYAMVDDDGEISSKGNFKTLNDSSFMICQMVKIIKQYQVNNVLAGIGVSAPGIVRKDGFMVTGGAIRAFNQFPLADVLKHRAGIPVAIENDANAAAIAEHWLGNAINIDNYITVVLGTGVGGGIVINGQVYRGAHGMAGEFGWNIIHGVDQVRDIEESSLNQRASVVIGLLSRYNQNVAQIRDQTGIVEDARSIIKLAQKGNRIAQITLQEFIQDICIMCLNLFSTFDPELILIGGGISANEGFMKELNSIFDEYVIRHKSIYNIRDVALGMLKPAKLRNDAGLIGAAYQIKKQLNYK